MAEKPARYGDWEDVATVSQVYEAELIASRLKESGIDAHVLDQSFEQIPLPNVADFEIVRVVVPADKAEEARRVLSTSAALPADVDVEGEPEVPSPEDEPVKE